MKSTDVVLDLGSLIFIIIYLLIKGCGDAKFLIEAAKKFGIKGYGIDILPDLIETANINAKKV